MPQAPTLEQNVFPEQGPLPNASGADFGAQVGEAQQGLGQQVSNAGDVAFKHVMQIQGLKNEATASDMDVQFQGDLGTLEDNYYSLKGKAAADAYPQFQTDLTALRSKYLTAAPNPMVQNMLQQSVGYSVGRSLRSAGQHAGQETKSWMIDAQSSRFASLGYAATKRFNDQGYADETDTARDAAIDNLGEIQGWSADHIALAKQQGRDELLANRQKAALDYAKGQPVADVVHSLVGTTGADSQSGPVGGQAYRAAVVATEFGSGQNDPNNPHQGPVQADDAWWARFGRGGDRNNTQDALKALDLETSVNLPQLKEKLGRPVTDADLYLAHQQGLAGATAILTHPDAPASESVPLANIAANLPAGSGDPSTITGAQFANIWSKGFDQSGGIMAGNPASKNNQLDAAIAVLSDAQRQELTKTTLSAWRTQDAAVREQTNYDQAQQAKAIKEDLDKHVNAADQVVEANWANPSKNPPLDVAQLARSDPWYRVHPEAITAILNYRKNLDNKPDGGDALTSQLYRGYLDGTKTVDDFQEAYAPKDGTLGSISKTNLDFLMKAAKGKDDPDAASVKALKSKFISDNDHSIGTGTPITPDSEYRFNFDLEQAWNAKVAKGENPKDLITPGNKDYFGSLANLSHYSQTAADQLKAEADAQKPGLWERLFGSGQPAIPPELPTGTTYGGKLKDGRDWFLRPDGQKVALPPPAAPAGAPAPVSADTGPTAPLAP